MEQRHKYYTNVCHVSPEHRQLIATLEDRPAVVVDGVEEHANREHVTGRVTVARQDVLRCQVVHVGLCARRTVQIPLGTVVVRLWNDKIVIAQYNVYQTGSTLVISTCNRAIQIHVHCIMSSTVWCYDYSNNGIALVLCGRK